MLRKSYALFFIILIFLSCFNFVAAQPCKIEEFAPQLEKQVAAIRYQIAVIEQDSDNLKDSEKARLYNDLIRQCEELIKEYPDRAEPYTWKGICLSAQAKYFGLGALPNVFRARQNLEKSIETDPKACDTAALNALGMLYYKVPPFPIAFGSDKKAEEYFQRALSISSNLDTNYRYGEFLIEKGEREKGLHYLEKALSFPNRPGRKEESLKKQDIKNLIQSVKSKA